MTAKDQIRPGNKISFISKIRRYELGCLHSLQ